MGFYLHAERVINLDKIVYADVHISQDKEAYFNVDVYLEGSEHPENIVMIADDLQEFLEALDLSMGDIAHLIRRLKKTREA